MSEPGDFISRWSRRKRAAAEGRADAEQPAATENAAQGAPATSADAAPESTPPAEPEFDITSLPSIDSIGPDTDVSVFLKPGVPSSLRHAALRRVWVTDPAIRDFRAPQEMDWDFNSPGLPGFGEIGPDIDVQKMAARILGGAAQNEPDHAPVTAPSNMQALETSSGDAHEATDTAAVEAQEAVMLQSEEDIATQQAEPLARQAPRRHGRALPQ